jgi:hypothetical protein
MFSFPISTHRIQMALNSVFSVYLERPSVTAARYRLSDSGYPRVEQQLEKEDGLLFHYARKGDEWLLDNYSIIAEENIPAADRTVRIDHNEPKVSEIRALSSSLVSQLEMGNDLGDLTPEQGRAAAGEIRQIEQAFSASYVRPDFIMGLVRRSLRWIADKAGGALIGAAALALLAAIAAFFGLSP